MTLKNLETPGDVADYLAKIAAQGLKEKYTKPPSAPLIIQPKKRGRPKGSKDKIPRTKTKWVEGKKPGTFKKQKLHFLAKAPKPAKILANPQVALELRASHNINGVIYGPGPVRVPATLGQALMEQEQRAIAYDETWRDEKAYLIQPGIRGGSHLRLNRVSPAVFDMAIGEAQPIGAASPQQWRDS